jgi:tyrosine-protein phosphatase YwqE
MLFFGKKKNTKVDISWLGTDMHSHLIPGIDDGSPDLTTSLELVKGLHALGYKKLITTPHILWDMYPNTPESIQNGIVELRKAIVKEGIDIELHAAAEYYIDEHFEDELRNKVPLLTISGNKVLVEISMVNAKIDLIDILFDMQIQNYQPVIAHPERYTYLNKRRNIYDEMKENGCLFQLNLLSLTGHYGKTVQELAEYLVKKDYYDLAGTDLHNSRHLSILEKLSTASNLLEHLKNSGKIQNSQL